VNPNLLGLTPKRFLCPYCGKWHEWEWNQSYEWSKSLNLGYYNSNQRIVWLKCPNASNDYYPGNYGIFFKDRYCYYIIKNQCVKASLDFEGKIEISSITESSDKPIVTFKVPFTPNRPVGSEVCSDCSTRHKCHLVLLDTNNYNDYKQITFGFEFEESEYNKYANVAILAHKEKKLQECKQAINSKEHALREHKDAVVSKEQVFQRSQVKENKEDTSMTNNIFNINMEFGPNKDKNIASTLMGIAVKNGNSWRIYDKKKKEITDVGNISLGNFPIFILPTTQLREGDLIKDAGKYYFVTKVATPNTQIQTISARTGEIKSIIPIKNALGFSCYSKVIALSDSLNIENNFDVEKLAIMSAMSGQTSNSGGQMNQLLPLMLFKDKLGGDNDTMKLLLMSSMMTSKDDSQQMNQLLPLMLLKDKLVGDDDTMKLLLMSSMMGDTMAGSNNPLMNCLMLDTLMSKKEDKPPQDGNDSAQ